MDTVIENAISGASQDLADKLNCLTSEPYFREAVVKMGVREVAWALFHAFKQDRDALQEQLELMAELIEKEGREPLPPY